MMSAHLEVDHSVRVAELGCFNFGSAGEGRLRGRQIPASPGPGGVSPRESHGRNDILQMWLAGVRCPDSGDKCHGPALPAGERAVGKQTSSFWLNFFDRNDFRGRRPRKGMFTTAD
jgi:hypothetical protein